MSISGKTKMSNSNLSIFLASMFIIVLHEKNLVRELTPREVEDLIDRGKTFKVLSFAKENEKIVVHLI